MAVLESPMSDKNKEKRNRYSVTPEQFISAWQTSETTLEVAQKLDMPIPLVISRASQYRRQKIKLKKLRKTSNKALDVDALNRLIEEIDEQMKNSEESEKTP